MVPVMGSGLIFHAANSIEINTSGSKGERELEREWALVIGPRALTPPRVPDWLGAAWWLDKDKLVW